MQSQKTKGRDCFKKEETANRVESIKMSLFSDIEAISDLGKSFSSEPMEVQDLLEIDD